jgi:pyridoxamine 5'-phosphate oxidase
MRPTSTRAHGCRSPRFRLVSLSDIRREYAHATLSERDADPDPIRQFERWFEDARAAGLPELNAMTLATATPDGAPSARIVLLKAVDAHGFVFFTDYRSRKGAELDANPRAALVLYWGALERQVRITGPTGRIGREESAAYFNSRPLGSRLSAMASHQSSVVASRAVLEARAGELAREYSDRAPEIPAFWGGTRVMPETIEFWQGRPNRLHDRLRYTRDADGQWRMDRLSP